MGSVKLNPCPRCACPFVELDRYAHDGKPSITCHSCMLRISVPVSVEELVKGWNEWTSANYFVQTTADRAPRRIERLVSYLLKNINYHRFIIGHDLEAKETAIRIVRAARYLE